MKSSAREIPEEVLFQILIRLPVKSLCRFRSVSTSWHLTIADPYFIRSHYAHFKTRKLLVMGTTARRPFGWHIYDADHPEQVTVGEFPNGWLGSHVPGPSPSVHGLLCLRDVNHCDVHLLNPSTGENKSISQPPVTGFLSGDCERMYHYRCHFFGFDPVSDKHKVIYFYETLVLQPPRPTIWGVEQWVFTLGIAEEWRMIRVVKHYLKEGRYGEVCIDGVIYFMATTPNDEPREHRYSLAAFDLKSESFQIVKLAFPGEIDSYKLIEFNGSVALVDRYLNSSGNRRTINVWALEDFHKQVWNLKRSILAPDSWLGITTPRWSLCLACALCGGEQLVFTLPGNQEVGGSSDLFFCGTKNGQFWRSGTRLLLGDIFAQTSILSPVMISSDHVESLLPLSRNSKPNERLNITSYNEKEEQNGIFAIFREAIGRIWGVKLFARHYFNFWSGK